MPTDHSSDGLISNTGAYAQIPMPPPPEPSNPVMPQQQAPSVPPLPPQLSLPVASPVNLEEARGARNFEETRVPTLIHSTHFQTVSERWAERIVSMGNTMPLAYRYFLAMVDDYNYIMETYYHGAIVGCGCPACSVPRPNMFKVRVGNLLFNRGGVNILHLQFITGNGADQRSRSHRVASHRHAINYIKENKLEGTQLVSFDMAVATLDELFLNYQFSTSWTPEEFTPSPTPPNPPQPYVNMRGHGVNRVGVIHSDYSSHDISVAGTAMAHVLVRSTYHLYCHVVTVNGMAIPVPDARSIPPVEMRHLTLSMPSRVISLISEMYRSSNHDLMPTPNTQRLTPFGDTLSSALNSDEVSQAIRGSPFHLTSPPAAETCPNCGRRHASDRMTNVPRVSLVNSAGIRPMVGDVRICVSCANNHQFTCPSCNLDWVGVRSATDTGIRICAACINNLGWHRCGNCGNYTQNRLRGGRCVCENCETNTAIVSYSTRADTTPRGGEGPRFFGIELEVVAHGLHRNRVAKLVTSWWDGDAICKNDGSLPESGFEIVTSPGTIEWHREKWKGFLGWSRTKSGAINLRSFREQQCGLHIHYSKHSISTTARGRLIAFMNNPNNEPLICSIAGRMRNTYCGTRENLRMSSAVNDGGTDHYSATNLCNPCTDEIRVFKGTLNLKRVLLYLDFTDSMMDYCSQPMISVQRGKSFTHYKEFVLATGEKWPYLHRYFQHGDAWLKRWAFDADRLLEIPAESVAATDE